MPSELRHLLFRPAEVVQAVKEYHRRAGVPLPSGAVARCGPEAEGTGVRFRITLVLDQSKIDQGKSQAPSCPAEGEEYDLVIEGPALAAALILHCRDRRIPLPAVAEKSLTRFGEQTCLVATINPKQVELPQPGQLRL